MRKTFVILFCLTVTNFYGQNDSLNTLNSGNPDKEEIANWKVLAEKYEKSKNYNKMFEYYMLAAKTGDAESQNYVGALYEAGKGVEKSFKLAYYWYSKSANQNYARGQFNLAYLYFNGDGVEKDRVKCEELMIKAAQQGDTDIQYTLGLKYSLPDNNGFYYDSQKAKYWLLLAANNNHINAQEELAALYFMEEDLERAVRWYLKAANNGNKRAQFIIGYLFKKGKGVKKSKKKAKEWWKKSCSNGHEGACKELEKMNAQ